MTQQYDYTGAPIRAHMGRETRKSVYVGPQGATDPASASARRMPAKFAGKCPLCRGEIAVGDAVAWEPGRRAVHQQCPLVEVPAPAPAPAPEPEPVTVDQHLEQPQVVLARVAVDFTDEQLERAMTNPLSADDPIIWAVLDAELDARMEAANAPAAPAPAPVQPQRLEVEDAGVYVLPDGTVVKVQANRDKTKVYAKRWTPSRQDRLMETGEHEHGEYVYEPGLIREVEATGRKMTLEEAKAHSIRYGRCVRCGRTLTDGKSVEQGMGPVCITYFS